MGQIKKPDAVSHAASRKQAIIALFTVTAIGIHVILRFGLKATNEACGLPLYELPLIAALVLGGVPLVLELLSKLCRMEFGSDLLAGISIVTSVVLGEYLAGSLVVLMLSVRRLSAERGLRGRHRRFQQGRLPHAIRSAKPGDGLGMKLSQHVHRQMVTVVRRGAHASFFIVRA